MTAFNPMKTTSKPVSSEFRFMSQFKRQRSRQPPTNISQDSDATLLPDPRIESIYLMPFVPTFRPLMAEGEVIDCLDEVGDPIALEAWTRLPCMAGSVLDDPLGKTVPSNRRAYRELQCRLRLDHATMQTLLALAMPNRNRYILILRMMDGRFLLCPYQSGMSLLSPLWVYGGDSNRQTGHPVVFFGYGVDGLKRCRDGFFEGPMPMDERFSMAFDWSAERIPLELIRLKQVAGD